MRREIREDTSKLGLSSVISSCSSGVCVDGGRFVGEVGGLAGGKGLMAVVAEGADATVAEGKGGLENSWLAPTVIVSLATLLVLMTSLRGTARIRVEVVGVLLALLVLASV